MGVGVQLVEEHDGVVLEAVAAVSHRDAVGVHCEVDQGGVDAEMVGDLAYRPLLVDVEGAQLLGLEFDSSGAGRSGRLDDVEFVVSAPAGDGRQPDVVGGGDVGSANAGAELSLEVGE